MPREACELMNNFYFIIIEYNFIFSYRVIFECSTSFKYDRMK